MDCMKGVLVSVYCIFGSVQGDFCRDPPLRDSWSLAQGLKAQKHEAKDAELEEALAASDAVPGPWGCRLSRAEYPEYFGLWLLEPKTPQTTKPKAREPNPKSST